MLDLGLDMSASVGEMMPNILVTVAQFERRRIGERTKEGLAVVKQRGPAPDKKSIGRPKEVADAASTAPPGPPGRPRA